MKLIFSLESDNLEDDIKKIIETIGDAICRDTEREVSRAKLLNMVEAKDVTEQVKGLDNRIDGIESRLSFCEVDLKEASKKEKK